jgi:hypothetical membrane protein
MDTLAILTITTAILSLLCLVVLHFVSPEFKPGWRMISEYALGKHKWLLTSFFLLWGLSSICLSILLWDVVSSPVAKIGILFLLISGIGEIMGGLFDVNHKHHGLAFLLGVPALPVAALILGYHLINLEGWNHHASAIILSSHSTWISLIIMAVAMGIMFAGFKKSGIPMDKNAPPPDKVPDGVIALGGYANRLLVLCYILWLIVIANISINI